jgi:hypothetical protein
MSTVTMTQDPNQSGTAFASDLTDALNALNSAHSGATAPTLQVVAGKLWLDTSGANPVLKNYRNGWKSLFTLNSTTVDMSIDDVSGVTGTIATLNSTNITASAQVAGATGAFTSITATGDIEAANFNTTSDVRLKDNIETIDNSYDIMNNIRGVSYTMFDKPQVGVIAQEVEAVLPEVITQNTQGYKSVAYGNMVGVLIEYTKDLEKRITALEEKKCCNC